MTTTMHDNITSDENSGPTSLRPGTVVHLWAPGELVHVDRPIRVRVERATVHCIVGVDLRDGARARYDVGHSVPVGRRWYWEKATDPQRPHLADGIPFIERSDLDLDQRRRFLFGEEGATVTVFPTSGPPVAGVVTAVMMDGPDPIWIEVSPPVDDDPRGLIMHRIRWEHIATIQQVIRG